MLPQWRYLADAATFFVTVFVETEQALVAREARELCCIRAQEFDVDLIFIAHALKEAQRLGVQAAGVEAEDLDVFFQFPGHHDQCNILRTAKRDGDIRHLFQHMFENLFRLLVLKLCVERGDILSSNHGVLHFDGAGAAIAALSVRGILYDLALWVNTALPCIARGMWVHLRVLTLSLWQRGIALEVVCLDLEGVLVPEIWIGFAERTGIDELRATTRDIPDYDVLMRQRLRILNEHKLGLPDIQAVIAEMSPMPGAPEFVNWLRERFQVVILSDTFYEFSQPLMRQLGFPTLFCHRLITDETGKVTDYKLRQKDPKRQCVKAFHELNYTVMAAGDSYNDTTMLSEADLGVLFRAPQNVIDEFPQFASVTEYKQLQEAFAKGSPRIIAD